MINTYNDAVNIFGYNFSRTGSGTGTAEAVPTITDTPSACGGEIHL